MTTDNTAFAQMLIQTTEGFREARTHSIQSVSLKDIVAHVRKGGLTAGFSITHAVNPDTQSVVCVMKKGHLAQRDLKTLVANGYREWHYSWAWSGKRWRFVDGTEVDAADIDLIKNSELRPWARAFGM
jgi:hypothetical protein